MNPINNSAFRNIDALRASMTSSKTEGVKVDGNTISWPDDGWYSVQSATSYNTMSEGGRSASMPAGTYNVINHTTGERFENIVVGPMSDSGVSTKDALRNEPEIFDPNPFGSPIGNVGYGEPIPGINDLAEGFHESTVAAIFDGLNERPAPTNPPPTISTSTVYGEGTDDEAHVISTTSPDTSASTSNQPFTTTTTIINPQGVVFTETTVRSPTGVTYRPAGLNGVVYEDPEESTPAAEAPAAATGSSGTRPTSNQNSDNDSNSHGGGSVSSSQSAADAGFGTSERGEFG